jgi:hypothetical protein
MPALPFREDSPFFFDGPPKPETLARYLRRAITMAELFHSDTLEDDLRMVANLGAKFLGRAAFVWEHREDDETHFALAARLAAAVHAQDPEIVLQAAIFEAVFEDVDSIPVPPWAFRAFGRPPQARTFHYRDMLFEDGRFVGQWGPRGSVPDITRPETRLWFHYRACRYIDAGYECLHLGQVHLYGNLDRGCLHFKDLLDKIRAFARDRARRHWVICDAHTHGLVVEGRLLLDVHDRILFMREIPEAPRRTVLVPQGLSRGGITPSGRRCAHAPFLLEIDNYGGSCSTAPASIQAKGSDGAPLRPGQAVPGPLWPWGYDEIAWFAHEDAPRRDEFLRYAHRWIAAHVPAGFLLMPGRRTLGSAPVEFAGDDGRPVSVDWFHANTRSAACPFGFGTEETIRSIWAAEKPPPPSDDLLADAEPAVRDPATGFHLPDLVVLAGTIQGALGGQDWDPSSAIGRMTHRGAGTYACRLVFPRAGTWRYRVCVGGSWTENYGPGGIADGGDFTLAVPRNGACVDLEFDYPGKVLRSTTSFGD